MFDPEEFRLLIPYAGCSIGFELTPFPRRFFCILPNGLLQPIAATPVGPDLIIEGLWSDFARYLLGNPKALHISGNLELAQVCQQVFLEIDQDVGAWLDRLFGTTVSNILTPPLQLATKAITTGIQTIQQDVSEYFQYESSALAPQHLLEDYLVEVDELRHWEGRLEARIIQLEKNLKPNETT
jgi:hypothetical protein